VFDILYREQLWQSLQQSGAQLVIRIAPKGKHSVLVENLSKIDGWEDTILRFNSIGLD
jgi:hypothetical protein